MSRSAATRKASSAPRSTSRPVRGRLSGFFRFVLWIAGILLLVSVCWPAWVIHRIDQVAAEDQAQPADAIAVFGAAEYNGRPSPVYHARLDHAVSLYQKEIAPVIITLGGAGDRNSGKTEGGVGRDYLLARGVPLTDIIAETRSIDTSQQAVRLAAIARQNGMQHVVVVSDGTHLFRIKALCEAAGLDVYTSPRPALGHISDYDLTARYFHEVVSYTAMRLGLDETGLHHGMDGKSED